MEGEVKYVGCELVPDELSPSEIGICEPLLAKAKQQKQRLSRSISNVTSQLAIVGSNVSPIESLDYEIIENDLFKHDWRSRTRIQIFQYIILKWTLAFLIGILTGLVGFTINLAVENIAGTKFVITNNLMLQQSSTLCLYCSSGCRIWYTRS